MGCRNEGTQGGTFSNTRQEPRGGDTPGENRRVGQGGPRGPGVGQWEGERAENQASACSRQGRRKQETGELGETRRVEEAQVTGCQGGGSVELNVLSGQGESGWRKWVCNQWQGLERAGEPVAAMTGR